MEELTPEWPVTYEKVFYNEHIEDFEKGSKNYASVNRNIVVRVDDTKECSELFDSFLGSFPDAKIRFHVVKDSVGSENYTWKNTEEFHPKEGSSLEDMASSCKRLEKDCMFSSIPLKSAGLETLVGISKKVGAKHIFDLDRVSKNSGPRIMTFYRNSNFS